MGIFNDNSQNNNAGGNGQPGLPGQKGDPGIGFKPLMVISISMENY